MWSVLAYFRCFIYQAATGASRSTLCRVELFYLSALKTLIIALMLEFGPLANVALSVLPVPVFNCEPPGGPGPRWRKSCVVWGGGDDRKSLQRGTRVSFQTQLFLCEISRHSTRGQFFAALFRLSDVTEIGRTQVQLRTCSWCCFKS